nr:hypothetical protein CFP56_28338 [Quercus suber]
MRLVFHQPIAELIKESTVDSGARCITGELIRPLGLAVTRKKHKKLDATESWVVDDDDVTRSTLLAAIGIELKYLSSIRPRAASSLMKRNSDSFPLIPKNYPDNDEDFDIFVAIKIDRSDHLVAIFNRVFHDQAVED